MSCEESRGRYLAAVSAGVLGKQSMVGELERLFQRERGTAANALEEASNEAKTRLLFAQFARCDPPLRPPTHSASGLPRRDAQRGYARLYDRLTELAAGGQLQRCPDCGQFGQPAGHLTCPAGASAANIGRQETSADTPATVSIPDRQYTYRNSAVAAEVSALPAVADPGFMLQALATSQPETAAHAVRQLLRADQPQSARRVGEHLAGLIGPRVAAIARSHFPGQPELREELVQELNMRVWQDLIDLRASQDFITYNCPCVLNRIGARLAYRLGRPVRHERQFARGGEGEDTWLEEERLAADTADLEAVAVAEEMLAALEPRERLVAYLLARGVPISSPNPQEATIAGMMGVTDRSVRNYRRAAGRQLQAAGLAPPRWLQMLNGPLGNLEKE